MWMPRKWRNQLDELHADADRRLVAAHAAAEQSAAVRRKADPVIKESERLARENSIAAIIADSLRVPRPPEPRGGNHAS